MQILNLKDVPQYLHTLAGWHQQQWRHLNPGQSLQQRIEKMHKYLDAQFIPTTYVAIERNLLGSAAIVAQDMQGRPELSPWLASVYVHPEYRCRGTGSALVMHTMREAYRHGINDLYLFTPDHEKFYQRLGWHCLERSVYHGFDVSIMLARLAQLV